MKTCPNCKAQQVSDDITACANCGYIFDARAAFSGDTPADDEDLDFVVYEAHDEKREFVGEEPVVSPHGREDDLGIETTANLMEQEASNNAETGGFPSLSNSATHSPIGESAPPPPPPAYEEPSFGFRKSIETDSVEDSPAETSSSGAIRRLTEEELKRIERNLYGSKTFVSEKEKSTLINKLDDLEPAPFDSSPIIPPKKSSSEDPADRGPVAVAPTMHDYPINEKPQIDAQAAAHTHSPGNDLPSPQMSKRGKGIAFFYKNYIELRGAGEMCANDEIIVNNREYILRPKRIKRGYLMGGAVGAFVIILIAVASFFITDTSGYGELVGVVLNSNDTPYIQGATIRFPDLGMSIKSNEQGFFKVDHIPTGTHKIEYIVGTNIMKVDYATVANNEISTVSLRPQSPEAARTDSKPVVTAQVQPNTNTGGREAEINQPSTPPSPPANTNTNTGSYANTRTTNGTSRSKTTTVTKTATKDEYGNVTLAANVQGARFEIDGTVMGAGNLRYQRIKPGRHSYAVSLEGYNPVKGTFDLASGESKTLQVALAPMETAQKKANLSQDDFYYSGTNAFKNGDYETALSDLNQYIQTKPSSADAYFYKAQAEVALVRPAKAYDDFVHAAELYQIKGNFNDAITSYNKAIELDGKTVTAFLGRAATYMNKGEELAAIADYDKVIYLDRRNFQAYFGLGEARYRQGQYKQAIEQFKNARSVNETNALVHQYLTLAYLGDDDYKNVKKSYEKFQDYATKEEMNRFKDNSKYATVVKIVQMH